MSQRARLLCHPALMAPPAVRALDVALARDDGLHVRFTLQGDLGALSIPAPGSAEGFTDGLWQHTCCELFVAVPGQSAYREFNFAPSGAWAAYAFDDYRQRDTEWVPVAAPAIRVEQTGDTLTLDADLPATVVPAAPILHVGLTAVVEATDATLSYWALTHAGPRPDFHLQQSFTLILR